MAWIGEMHIVAIRRISGAVDGNRFAASFCQTDSHIRWPRAPSTRSGSKVIHTLMHETDQWRNLFNSHLEWQWNNDWGLCVCVCQELISCSCAGDGLDSVRFDSQKNCPFPNINKCSSATNEQCISVSSISIIRCSNAATTPCWSRLLSFHL